jgi:hypothetical protein
LNTVDEIATAVNQLSCRIYVEAVLWAELNMKILLQGFANNLIISIVQNYFHIISYHIQFKIHCSVQGVYHQVIYSWIYLICIFSFMFFSRQPEIMEKTQSWKGHHFVVEVPTPNVYQISICELLALFQNSEHC